MMIMRRVLICLLLSFGLCSARTRADDDFRGTRLSYFQGKEYSFDLRVTALAKAPLWLHGADFPPLPPLKARDLALARARTLCPEVKEWGTDLISLQEIGRGSSTLPSFWIYVVGCEDDDGPYSGPPRILEIPVLMNGAIPEPHIHPAKRPF
jgi:hypothetical protein